MRINKDVETSLTTLSILDPLQDRKQGCSTYHECTIKPMLILIAKNNVIPKHAHRTKQNRMFVIRWEH